MIKFGIDASSLVENKTGVGNYIYQLLIEMVKNKDIHFILYSNQDIFFIDDVNITKVIHKPYRKGPAWQNTQLLISLLNDKLDYFWGGNGYLPIYVPKKTKSILTIHDLVYKQAGATMPFISRLSRKIFQPLSVKKANKIIAVSQATANDMSIEYGRKPDCIIHPQVSLDYNIKDKYDCQYIFNKYDLGKEFILTLGTLEPRKNLESLVKAYLELFYEGRKLPLLVISGGKGWLEGELPELILQAEKLGIIKKTGFVAQEDMSALYSAATAFILPSLYEGFGMPVLEAQLCGTPVLISDIPSLEEASLSLACKFIPTIDGIKALLIEYMNNSLPLVCRLPETSTNNPELAAKKMMETLGVA